ncbi:60S ribosomal protein L8, mitochondrial [Wickerhamomyces ciferrii]|uniref:60S ribosomal protein L8, mitochondrial n=1 Tax=Wickerhamomyces ciferrii (strain ATCC 14091 / BCRC 22168 / CBS 111 / JCM 3599 / NBRC 0793 / NRRL Y-1031 F-60-10) TaxID=1206466 RepID=K0KEE2_WICCF|nr:60S ribosomal protein L8, mitochondrial [Wickerhamomyces ciferrii]CCH43505.1 60S ribosomal protein L8, mitochondrial [Wickerhamomyces ciferrii]
MPAPRKFSRTPEHRRAMLRNLVTSLIEHESIITTHAKAKETQKLADKLISLTKRKDVKQSKQLACADLFKLDRTIPKLFKVLNQRYTNRIGGFTRVLKLEPRLGDHAEQSIVELVDGPKEMRFWLLARIVARLQKQNLPIDELTKHNVSKLIAQRPGGQKEFDDLVERCKEEFYKNPESYENLPPPAEKMRKPYTSYTLKKGIEFLQRPLKSLKSEKSE